MSQDEEFFDDYEDEYDEDEYYDNDDDEEERCACGQIAVDICSCGVPLCALHSEASCGICDCY